MVTIFLRSFVLLFLNEYCLLATLLSSIYACSDNLRIKHHAWCTKASTVLPVWCIWAGSNSCHERSEKVFLWNWSNFESRPLNCFTDLSGLVCGRKKNTGRTRTVTSSGPGRLQINGLLRMGGILECDLLPSYPRIRTTELPSTAGVAVDSRAQKPAPRMV